MEATRQDVNYTNIEAYFGGHESLNKCWTINDSDGKRNIVNRCTKYLNEGHILTTKENKRRLSGGYSRTGEHKYSQKLIGQLESIFEDEDDTDFVLKILFKFIDRIMKDDMKMEEKLEIFTTVREIGVGLHESRSYGEGHNEKEVIIMKRHLTSFYCSDKVGLGQLRRFFKSQSSQEFLHTCKKIRTSVLNDGNFDVIGPLYVKKKTLPEEVVEKMVAFFTAEWPKKNNEKEMFKVAPISDGGESIIVKNENGSTRSESLRYLCDSMDNLWKIFCTHPDYGVKCEEILGKLPPQEEFDKARPRWVKDFKNRSVGVNPTRFEARKNFGVFFRKHSDKYPDCQIILEDNYKSFLRNHTCPDKSAKEHIKCIENECNDCSLYGYFVDREKKNVRKAVDEDDEDDDFLTIKFSGTEDELKIYNIEDAELAIQNWIQKKQKPILRNASNYPANSTFEKDFDVKFDLDDKIECHKFRLRMGGKNKDREIQVNTTWTCNMYDFLVQLEDMLIAARSHNYGYNLQSRYFHKMRTSYLPPGTLNVEHDCAAKFGIMDGTVMTQAQFMTEGCETMTTDGFLLTANRSDIDDNYELDTNRPLGEDGKPRPTLTFGHFVLTTAKADHSVFHDETSRQVYNSETGLKIFNIDKISNNSDGHPGMLKNSNGLQKELDLYKELELVAAQRAFQKGLEGKGPVDSSNGAVCHIQKTAGVRTLGPKARSARNMALHLKKNHRKVKRMRYNSVENRNFHSLSSTTLNKRRREEIKFKTLKSKKRGSVMRSLHNFLYLKDDNREEDGWYARNWYCAEDDCDPCVTGQWGKFNEETGFMEPACTNPACGEWEFYTLKRKNPFPNSDQPRKKRKIEKNSDSSNKSKEKQECIVCKKWVYNLKSHYKSLAHQRNQEKAKQS